MSRGEGRNEGGGGREREKGRLCYGRWIQGREEKEVSRGEQGHE